MKAFAQKTLLESRHVRQDRRRPASRGAESGDQAASRLTAPGDDRPGTLVQPQVPDQMDQGPRRPQHAQLQAMIDASPRQAAQREQWVSMFGPARLGPSAVAVSSQPLQRTMAPGRTGDVVQRAGTKPNQPSADGKYRIKLSSEREKFSYDNRVALGLDNVLPGHYQAIRARRNNEGDITEVKLADETWVPLKAPIPWPQAGQKVLVIDTVGYQPPRGQGQPADNKLFMDIKIGHYTKSGQQWQLEGANLFWRVFKNIEHEMKDRWRTSDEFGYDIDAENLTRFDAVYAQAQSRQAPTLWAAMAAIWPGLKTIEQTMAAAPVTFVGASVFIVFNLTAPQDSSVKIIDPDHPILLDAPQNLGAVPGGVMTEHKMQGDRNWDEYKRKWQWNFGSGMTRFCNWFASRANALPRGA